MSILAHPDTQPANLRRVGSPITSPSRWHTAELQPQERRPLVSFRHDPNAWKQATDLFLGRRFVEGFEFPSRAQRATMRGRSYVYVLFDSIGRPAYVGSTINLAVRLNDHRKCGRGRYRWVAVEAQTECETRTLETAVLSIYLPYLNRRRAA